MHPTPTVPSPFSADPVSQNRHCNHPTHRGLENAYHLRASHTTGIAELAQEWQDKRTAIAVEKAKAAGNVLEYQRLSELHAKIASCAEALTALAEQRDVVIDF